MNNTAWKTVTLKKSISPRRNALWHRFWTRKVEVFVKRWTTSSAFYVVNGPQHAFRRGEINIFNVRAYKVFIRFQWQKYRFRLDEMHFDINLHCENTGFLQNAAQKSSVFTWKIDDKMHFVEAKSIFWHFWAPLRRPKIDLKSIQNRSKTGLKIDPEWGPISTPIKWGPLERNRGFWEPVLAWTGSAFKMISLSSAG